MRRKLSNQIALLWACVLACGCNDHPVEKLDTVLTAVDNKATQLPAKTKIDFLFVIDNSGSMCEEQENLTRNFSAISDFLFDELGAAADYRLAVISTDMHAPNKEMGRFLRKPAEATPSLNCLDKEGNPRTPDTADCAGLDLPQVIDSSKLEGESDEAKKADLEKKFKCLATLGTRGDGFEKGLESMRVSLSCASSDCMNACLGAGNSRDDCLFECRAPNADLFGTCCNADGTYNPGCVIKEGEEEPTFLRPDAILVVVFITDEDDCSDPVTNPAASKIPICKYGKSDSNGDGIPDGFADPKLCGRLSLEDCFYTYCGVPESGNFAQQADLCYEKRCKIGRDDNSYCEWYRDQLTPVSDYYEFLTNLKAQPIEQLVVATIVGNRDYTTRPNGHVITYNSGVLEPACVDEAISQVTRYSLRTEECCPEGECKGTPYVACSSETNGEAFAGKRYLELVEMFEDNGIGCPQGSEPDPEHPEETSDECVTICQDDFAKPLSAIKNKVITIIGTYCLDKAPSCEVASYKDENGKIVPSRPCETEEEFAEQDNYLIQVKKSCLLTTAEGGYCEEVIPERVLCPGLSCQKAPESPEGPEWVLKLGVPSCPGNASIELVNTPEAGSEITIEFLAGSGSTASTDAGVPAAATSSEDTEASADEAQPSK